MKNIELKLTGNPKHMPVAHLDGQFVKFKKNEFGTHIVNYTTDKDEVELTLTKTLEISSKWWFLWAILYFFISLFGILDSGYPKDFVVVDCKYILKLDKDLNKFTIKSGANKDGKQIAVESENEMQEVVNNSYFDKKLKRRWVVLLVAKLLVWLGMVIGIVALLFM